MSRPQPTAALLQMWQADADRGVDVTGPSREVNLPIAVSRPPRPPFEIEAPNWFEETP